MSHSKRLVICCDGTWNSADQHQNGEPCPTSVLRLAYRVAASDGTSPQVVHYNQGVGTGNKVDRWLGGAFGTGLEDNLFEAYRFLVANYNPGDEIYLFGFSRGAFTARSLAGLVRTSGILARSHVERYGEALALYRGRNDAPATDRATKFRRTFSIEPFTRIKLVGVWDTVGARGIPISSSRRKYEFHDLELSGAVEHGYHALALNEHRKPYNAALWSNAPKHLYTYPGDGIATEAAEQTVQQVWFVGAHSDVGGGYGGRSTANLSDIPLRWMITRAEAAGLAFDANVARDLPLRDDSESCAAELHNSYSWKFKVAGRITRTPGRTTTEYVHRTVLDRLDLDLSPKYESEALAGNLGLDSWRQNSPRPDTFQL